MGKVDDYRSELVKLGDWDAYLLLNSGLPGRRANLELAWAVADLASAERLQRYVDDYPPGRAPENTPACFLAFCGTVGLGRLAAEGQLTVLSVLRDQANDPRWRIREAVSQALQRYGRADPEGLLAELAVWRRGTWLEQRAVVATLCEPELLTDLTLAERILTVLDETTQGILAASDRRDSDLRVLRQALGYCWSVAVVAAPVAGLPLLDRWLASPDPDIRWIMRQNLKKKRLQRIDPAWVEAAQAKVASR